MWIRGVRGDASPDCLQYVPARLGSFQIQCEGKHVDLFGRIGSSRIGSGRFRVQVLLLLWFSMRGVQCSVFVVQIFPAWFFFFPTIGSHNFVARHLWRFSTVHVAGVWAYEWVVLVKCAFKKQIHFTRPACGTSVPMLNSPISNSGWFGNAWHFADRCSDNMLTPTVGIV